MSKSVTACIQWCFAEPCSSLKNIHSTPLISIIFIITIFGFFALLQIFQWKLHKGGPSGLVPCKSSQTWVRDIQACTVLEFVYFLSGLCQKFDFQTCQQFKIRSESIMASMCSHFGNSLIYLFFYIYSRYSYAIVGINLTEMAYSLLRSGALKPHFYNTVQGTPGLQHFHQLYCE